MDEGMKMKQISKLLVNALLIMATLTACAGQTTATKPADQSTTPAKSDVVPVSLPKEDTQPAPLVLKFSPADGAVIQPSATVDLVFDQAMDRASVDKAFNILDAQGSPVTGKITWADDTSLKFTPDSGWPEASYFEIRLAESAAGKNGVALTRAFSSRFKTEGPLTISQVFPADGAPDVDTASSITVLFDRPVIDLQTKEDQALLADPIQITPKLKGKGNWVSTSIYTFLPDVALSSGTAYKVTIAKGLQDVTADPDKALQKDYTWSFTTRKPALKGLSVNDNQLDLTISNTLSSLPLLPKIVMQFTQPMDQAATTAAIALYTRGGPNVPFRSEWSKDSATLTITPKSMLAVGTNYEFQLRETAAAADGGLIDKPSLLDFSTVPAPFISSVYPVDGAQAIPDQRFSVIFGTPMNAKTIQQRVLISPQPKGKIQFYYREWDKEADFYGLDPSTSYTVQILPGMQDVYGNQITTPMEIHFTTGQSTPSAYFNMPSDALYRVDAPQDFFVNSTNVKKLHFTIYKLPAEDFVGYWDNSQANLPDSDRVSEFDFNPEVTLDKNGISKVSMKTADGKPLPAGAYMLIMDSDEITKYETQKYVDSRLFMITGTFLTLKTGQKDSLVWAIKPDTGAPVPGLNLILKGMDSDRNVTTLAKGTTDKDGLIHFNYDATSNTLFIVSDENSEFTFGSSNWNQRVSLNDFGLDNVYTYNEFKDTTYLYTDRPLYRPGQPVYFKGIMRLDNDLEYSIPSQKEVLVTVNSYDKEVFHQTLPLSASGTFNGQFNLDAEAALGDYSLSVSNPSNSSETYGYLSFNVAEYRKPDFKVKLNSDVTDVLTGGAFHATLQADYYSGGSLSGAKVDWTLTASPFVYNPPAKYSNYSFTSAALDDDWYAYRSNYESPRVLSQGSTTTDDNGKAEITVPAKVADSKASQALTFETTVTGLSGNPVSEHIIVNAHASQVITGIRPMQYVAKAGEEQSFEAVILDWSGNPVADQIVNVVVNERKWYSVQKEDAQKVLRWETTVKDIPVGRFTGKTDATGLLRGTYTPDHAGVYRAVATASDKAGNISTAAAYQWVAGKDYVAWRQTNDRTFQMVADKNLYNPGDTAEILIASPYQGDAYALITVERARIRKAEVIKLTGNSTLYHLPITEDMGPAVYLSISVVKGMDSTNTYPSYKSSIVRLNVTTDEKKISVDVTPDKKQASPGDKVHLTVLTKDSTGKPITAEVSLAMVDSSVLALADPNSGSITSFFYDLRGLDINTVFAQDMNIDEYNVQMNEIASGEKSGGGGGDDKGGTVPGVRSVRKNFPDTAYWNAVVITDAQGKAEVDVTLPGNLTTWHVDARAITDDTLVGQTTLDILSNKPLMVQPVTPRFFINGDQSTISALVTNNTKVDLPVTALLEAKGLTIVDSASQQVQVAAGKQELVSWKVAIPADSTRVDLTASVKGGDYEDASLAPLGTLDNQGIPVYRYEAPETQGTSGVLQSTGIRTEGIRLPQTGGNVTGNLRIDVEPSLVNGLEKGVNYLNDYPYESMDVTVSRFLTAIALNKALALEGKQTGDLQKKMTDIMNTSLQNIYANQNADGGWGWWSNTSSDSLTSAYVMLGLAKLKENDTFVTQDVIDRGSDYLVQQINSIRDDTTMPLSSRMDRQSFLLYALTINQVTKSTITNDLYENRASLSYYGRAMLLRVMDLQNHKDVRIQTMLADLISQAALSAGGASWEEKSHDWWNWSTDTSTTAIILGTLLQLKSDNALTINTVRWLMAHRMGECWPTTQETAWSLMTLADWMSQSQELQADYSYTVSLNDTQVGDGKVDASTADVVKSIQVDLAKLLTDQTNKLVISRTGDAGSLYYTTYMTVNLPVKDIQPLDQGFSLTRKYFNPKDLTKPVTSAKAGDLLMVELTIVVPQSLHYVSIEDPLPAGMEAVDSSLKTSPQGIFDRLYDWKTFGQEGWGWWYFTHTEQRDEKTALFANWLPAGTYIYHYYARATTAGQYQVLPPHGQEVYFPDVYSRGAGSEFIIQ